MKELDKRETRTKRGKCVVAHEKWECTGKCMEWVGGKEELRPVRWQDGRGKTQLETGWWRGAGDGEVNRYEMAWSASQLGDRELKASGTSPKIVSDRGRRDGEVWKQKGGEEASGGRRGVEIGCGARRAYVPGSGDELLYFSPTALGSVSISGRWRDTKPHSAGSIRSNHIPLQPALSTDSTKTNKQKNYLTHTNTHRTMTSSMTLL